MPTTTDSKTKQTDNADAKLSTASTSAIKVPYGHFISGRVVTKPETRVIKTKTGSEFALMEFQISDGESDAININLKADHITEFPKVKTWQEITARVIGMSHNAYSGIKLGVEILPS